MTTTLSVKSSRFSGSGNFLSYSGSVLKNYAPRLFRFSKSFVRCDTLSKRIKRAMLSNKPRRVMSSGVVNHNATKKLSFNEVVQRLIITSASAASPAGSVTPRHAAPQPSDYMNTFVGLDRRL
ncbi:hypothetical protein J6590_036798 [Homalodisca vitripennis]|nr:hypothetical protein J6590_036798 [Homalodisca vitripennis]